MTLTTNTFMYAMSLFGLGVCAAWGQLIAQESGSLSQVSGEQKAESGEMLNRLLQGQVMDRSPFPYFWVDINGGINIATASINRYPKSQLIEFLNHPGVRQALSIADEEINEIRSVTAYYEMSCLEYEAMRKEANEAKRSRRELVEYLENAKREIVIQLAAFLSPEQLQGLSRLLARDQVRRCGLLAQLVTGELGTQIGVTEEQQQLLLRKSETLVPALETETAELRKQIIEELLQVLTSDQREVLEKKLHKNLSEVGGEGNWKPDHHHRAVRFNLPVLF